MQTMIEIPPPAESPTRLRWLGGGLILMIILTVVTALGTLQSIRQQGRSSDWVNHTHAVMMEANELLTALHATEASIRSFAMSGTISERMAAYDDAQAADEHAEVLMSLTQAEPIQAAVADRLHRMLGQRRALLSALLDAPATETENLLNQLLTPNRNLPSLGDIKREVDKLQALMQAQLVAQDTENFRQARDRRWFAITGLTLNFALLGASAWLIRSDVVNRRRVIEHIQTENLLLSQRVQQQFQELQAAHDSLEAETLEQQWSLQALNHQIKYSKAVFNAVSDPLLVITKACNISRANPATLNLTGHTEEELLNQSLEKLIRFDSDDANDFTTASRLTAALDAGHEIREQSAVVLRGDQPCRPIKFDLYPLRDGDQVVGAVVLLRAIPPMES